MFGKKKKAKAKVELVSVETEEEFHAALDRGADVELTHELEKVGLMEEDVGTLITRPSIGARTWNSRRNSLKRLA